jgi:hypothetical protein
MKQLIFLFVILPFTTFAQAEYAILKLSDILIVEKPGDTLIGKPYDVYLKDGSRNKQNYIFRNQRILIDATFKVESFNSRRSSTKTGSIKVTVIYRCEVDGKKDKRTSEYIFYLDDERKFAVKELFIFKNGLKSTQLTLTYKGVVAE